MSDDEVARCVALRMAGVPVRTIAVDVHYGKSTIRAAIARHAPEFRDRRMARQEEAVRLHNLGLSAPAIARIVGYGDRRSVYRALAKARKEDAHG